MKKLCLLIALVASPVFAQEEEQEIQIEIEAGGGVEAGIASSDMGVSSAIAAFPDKSVWFRNFRSADEDATYCWVDENEEPRCKVVKVEED
jgi:hypothetical protein